MLIPTFGGNWVDLLIIVFLLCYVVTGFGRGFLINLIDLLGSIIAFLLALKLYAPLASLLVAHFSLTLSISNAVGFVILIILTEFIFFSLVRIIYGELPRSITASKLNSWLGFLPCVVNGLLLTIFFLILILITPVAPNIKEAVLTSRIGSPLVKKSQFVENGLAKIFGAAVNEGLLFLTVTPQSEDRVDLKVKLVDSYFDQSAETEMLSFVNLERKKIGLVPLIFSMELREVARAYAKEIFQSGNFAHIDLNGNSPFDRMKNADILFGSAGENLAFAQSAQLAHQGLMNSPGHRANILSADFKAIGIGVANGGYLGKVFVQNFTD